MFCNWPQKIGDEENQLTERGHVFCGLKKICLTPPSLGGGVIFFKWSKFIFSQFFAALIFLSVRSIYAKADWYFSIKRKVHHFSLDLPVRPKHFCEGGLLLFFVSRQRKVWPFASKLPFQTEVINYDF